MGTPVLHTISHYKQRSIESVPLTRWNSLYQNVRQPRKNIDIFCPIKSVHFMQIGIIIKINISPFLVQGQKAIGNTLNNICNFMIGCCKLPCSSSTFFSRRSRCLINSVVRMSFLPLMFSEPIKLV